MDRKTERIDENFDREIRKMAASSEFDQYRRVYPLDMPSTHYLAYRWVSQPSGLPLLETWPELKPVVQSKQREVVDELRANFELGEVSADTSEQSATLDSDESRSVSAEQGVDGSASGIDDGGIVAGTGQSSGVHFSPREDERQTLMAKSKPDLMTIGAERGVELRNGQNKAEMVAAILDVKTA